MAVFCGIGKLSLPYIKKLQSSSAANIKFLLAGQEGVFFVFDVLSS